MPMFENEVIVDSKDKENLLKHIKAINKILSKYQDSSCEGSTVTTISRAKSLAEDTETWIDCLDTNE